MSYDQEKYFLEKGILCKKTNLGHVIVVPKALVPFVLANLHFQTHGGAKKLLNLAQLQYFWKGMAEDVKTFCKGCVLCQIFKSTTTGQNEVGTPRIVLQPGKFWQIDVVSGLNMVKGHKSFLNIVCMYTGFAII